MLFSNFYLNSPLHPFYLFLHGIGCLLILPLEVISSFPILRLRLLHSFSHLHHPHNTCSSQAAIGQLRRHTCIRIQRYIDPRCAPGDKRWKRMYAYFLLTSSVFAIVLHRPIAYSILSSSYSKTTKAYVYTSSNCLIAFESESKISGIRLKTCVVAKS